MLRKDQVNSVYEDGLRKLKARRYFEARATFARIVTDYPQAAEAWYQMGRIDKMLGRPFSAAQCFEHGLKARPHQRELIVALEDVATRVGRSDYAAALNRRLLKQNPADLGAMINLGVALQQDGNFDEAATVFRKALKKAPKEGELFRAWFRSRKITSASDPSLVQALKLWKDTNQSQHSRMSLGFALSKAMEDLGRHDEVFTYLKPANEIGKTLYPFDRDKRRKEVEGFFAASPDPKVVRSGSSDFQPIFVIGTPRSGTTLTERIITAHPDVAAGGEISQAFFLHGVLMRPKGVVTALGDVDPALLESLARQFEISAREVSQASGNHVTDKSIQNNLIMGWLAAAFPKARFIVVRRNPCDVALSIYKNYFQLGHHSYSYDLEDIASVLHNFDRSIEHWRDRVEMTEVRYEDLISDPEPESRRLIAGAGLDWHDDCLEFYKQKSAVRTLSIAQVRQPIYKTSLEGWKRHEKEMQPFVDAWEAGQ